MNTLDLKNPFLEDPFGIEYWFSKRPICIYKDHISEFSTILSTEPLNLKGETVIVHGTFDNLVLDYSSIGRINKSLKHSIHQLLNTDDPIVVFGNEYKLLLISALEKANTIQVKDFVLGGKYLMYDDIIIPIVFINNIGYNYYPYSSIYADSFDEIIHTYESLQVPDHIKQSYMIVMKKLGILLLHITFRKIDFASSQLFICYVEKLCMFEHINFEVTDDSFFDDVIYPVVYNDIIDKFVSNCNELPGTTFVSKLQNIFHIKKHYIPKFLKYAKSDTNHLIENELLFWIMSGYKFIERIDSKQLVKCFNLYVTLLNRIEQKQQMKTHKILNKICKVPVTPKEWIEYRCSELFMIVSILFGNKLSIWYDHLVASNNRNIEKIDDQIHFIELITTHILNPQILQDLIYICDRYPSISLGKVYEIVQYHSLLELVVDFKTVTIQQLSKQIKEVSAKVLISEAMTSLESNTVIHTIIQNTLNSQNPFDSIMQELSTIKESIKQYSIQLLEKTDPTGLILGHLTNCCQSIDSDAESCVIAGYAYPFSGFLVIKKYDQIIAQAWIYVVYPTESNNTYTLVLDNIESLDNKAYINIIKMLLVKWFNTIIERTIIDNIHIGINYNDIKFPEALIVNKPNIIFPLEFVDNNFMINYDDTFIKIPWYTDAKRRVWAVKNKVLKLTPITELSIIEGDE